MFLLGAPCVGKTTLVAALRELVGCPVLDMDDELVRVNGGTWPDLGTKGALSSQVIAEASQLDPIILAHSRVDEEQRSFLTRSGWVIALLDAPEAVLRARADERLVRDGWSNVNWLPGHLRDIEELRAHRVFSYVFDGMLPTLTLVRMVADLVTGDNDGVDAARTAKVPPEQ